MDKEKPVSSMSFPVKGEAGDTGTWRTHRPIIDLTKCIAAKKNKLICMLCWLYCPEATISKTVPPKVDYQYCKGCGVCAEECPSKSISMEEEAKFRE